MVISYSLLLFPITQPRQRDFSLFAFHSSLFTLSFSQKQRKERATVSAALPADIYIIQQNENNNNNHPRHPPGRDRHHQCPLPGRPPAPPSPQAVSHGLPDGRIHQPDRPRLPQPHSPPRPPRPRPQDAPRRHTPQFPQSPPTSMVSRRITDPPHHHLPLLPLHR